MLIFSTFELAHSKTEAILRVEQPDGFMVDSSIRAEEPRRELLPSIVISPGINRSLV